MAFRHLILKDGTKVDLQESSSFAASLYAELRKGVPEEAAFHRAVE
jgi:hypothetical protein